MRPSARRHDLGVAAQRLREAIHFSRLGRQIDLAQGAELARTVGQLVDEFMVALNAEVRGEAIGPKDEPFFDAAHLIACRFEERAREINSENDPRADRACWKHHQREDA